MQKTEEEEAEEEEEEKVEGLWGRTYTSCPTVSGLITGVNEGPVVRCLLSLSRPRHSAGTQRYTGGQAQKPTSAAGSVTDTAQLMAANHTHTHTHTHKNMNA